MNKQSIYKALTTSLLMSLAGRCCATPAADSATASRDRSFDSDWRFVRADALGAEAAGFDDSKWRTLDVPHDWSIDDLPPLEKSLVPELSVTVGQWRLQRHCARRIESKRERANRRAPCFRALACRDNSLLPSVRP